jgi:phospholipid/cholesterol/gamma-HCH transport system ATP-binding protein
MIRFENVTTERASLISFEIQAGESCKLITNSESGERLLLDTILARKKPRDGKVFLFGEDVASLTDKQYMKLFSKVGIAWRDGGLISNLKVWENISLPACYHQGKRCDEIEVRATDLLQRLDIDVTTEYLGSLPGPLSVSQKSLIGVVRAMLMEPVLMIYDSIFEGLYPETADRLAALTSWFHTEKTGRTSIYITAHERSLARIPADRVLRPHEERSET